MNTTKFVNLKKILVKLSIDDLKTVADFCKNRVQYLVDKELDEMIAAKHCEVMSGNKPTRRQVAHHFFELD